MSNRRTFIKQFSGVAGAIALSQVFGSVFADEYKSISRRIANMSPLLPLLTKTSGAGLKNAIQYLLT